MGQRIKVCPPASVANLGSGFDTMGIALALFNTVEMEEWDTIEVSCTDGSRPVEGEKNLIWRTVREVYRRCGRTLPGLRLVQASPIPQARGLGSSSACIAAGVVGGNRLLGCPLSAQQQLDLATELEGHPDNVVPAMLGGFVTSAVEDGRVYAVKKPVSDGLRFCAFVPDFELLTEKARAALPAQIPHRDAVYNVSRAALMAAAFCEGRPELLRVGAQDRLHQPYRLPLIPGAEQVIGIAVAQGALAASSAGRGRPSWRSAVRRTPTLSAAPPRHWRRTRAPRGLRPTGSRRRMRDDRAALTARILHPPRRRKRCPEKGRPLW